jgi:hypothetical protein
MRHALTTLILAASLAIGCAKTGDVQEKVPLTADITTYKTASVEVTIPTSVKNAETQKTAFAGTISDKLREKKLFGDVTAGGGELTIKVNVTNVDEGSKLALAAGGGKSEVSATVDLFDTKRQQSIGQFDVKGNSKKDVHTSVGGVDTQAMEDTTGKALGAAADEIANYLDKHRGAAK